MELLYIYFQNYRNFKETAVPFSSEFIFTTSKRKNGQVGLKIEKNPHFIPDFFNNSRITNVSAIIGQNGMGKSNILDFIRNALPDGMGGFTDECIVITKSRIFSTIEFEYNVNSGHVDPAFWDVDPPAKRAIRVRA